MAAPQTKPAPRLKLGDTIGIMGGGQLGRMLAQAAARLGLEAVILCPDDACPAAAVSLAHIKAGYEDEAALAALAARAQIITYEFENVPAGAVEILTRLGAPVAPNGGALAVAQDRLVEKRFMETIGARTAPFYPVDSLADLEAGLEAIGAPAILKTRRFGYDGKGQTRIAARGPDAGDHLREDWEAAKEKAWREIGAKPSILEGFVDFVCEISVIGARGHDGAMRFYDPARNDHENGVLSRSTVPSGAVADALEAARKITADLLTALDYVGVVGVEFFVLADGSVLVNEFAPRVHNSGHWTEAACAVSQFEQHIRAVAGWPLGDPRRHSDAVMENLLGDAVMRYPDDLAEADSMATIYGKATPRPGRKMGHVTRITPRAR